VTRSASPARPAPPRRPWWRRRWVLAAGAVIAVPLLAVAVVVGSIWAENRAPSDAADASGLARVRGLVTRPVAGAVSEHVRRRVRTAAERRLEMTGMELSELIATMNDESLAFSVRRRHARRLGRVKSPDAIRALLDAFVRARPEHRAFFAQLLGSTGDPRVIPWLEPLLRDTDDEVVIAARTGLCSIEGHDPSALVGRILWDAERSGAVRVAAAVGLGKVGTPAAREELEAAFRALPPVALRDEVLTSLGRFPFAAVEDSFRLIMNEDTAAGTRVVAAEALFHSTPDAVPFLIEVARADRDDAVRESAAWAISAHEGGADVAARLADLALREPEADVRRRLYEAELAQRGIPAERLLPRVRQETDVAARVAGFNAIGQAVRGNGAGSLATEFDEAIVPELTRIATNPNTMNIRMRAVFALRRAGSNAAQDALRTIAATVTTPQVADAARHGLRPEVHD